MLVFRLPSGPRFLVLQTIHYDPAQRAATIDSIAHGTDNRAILDAIARSSGRLKGVAVIDASSLRHWHSYCDGESTKSLRSEMLERLKEQQEGSKRLKSRLIHLA